MASGKRYYWLKLKDDFFTSKRIKKLRNMAGGDTYLIIYLKMQLLALKTDGVLKWTGLEEKFTDELALDLDEKPDDVAMTLMYLLHTGLAETSDNINFFFPYVIENTGSEGASAQRWREWKARQALSENESHVMPPKTNAERQKAFRAKQSCEGKQHIPFIEDSMNRKRYNGNYYIVCQRDRFKCAICGSIENLCVHHIDGYDEAKPENNETNKMILLCRTCHSQVHAGTAIPQDILDAIDYDRNVTANTPLTDCKQITNGEKEKKKEIEIESEKKKRFTPPSEEEVRAYCNERNNGIDPGAFVDFYASKNWMVGKDKMSDWKAAVRTWERRRKENGNGPNGVSDKPQTKKYNIVYDA